MNSPGTLFRRKRTPETFREAFRYFAAAVLVASAAVAAPVSSGRWLDDVKYLSSDELRGRGDGMPELNVAADYIATEFRKAGLEPVSGSYFQPFTAATGVQMGSDNRLSRLDPQTHAYKLRQDFIPLSLSSAGDVTAPVVFVGYGITAPEYKYDDYQGVDVHGKIVLMLRYEPQENDEHSIFAGRQLTRYAEFGVKAITARQHGAAAIVIVNDPLNHTGDSLVPFTASSGPGDVGIPVVQVKEDVAENWLETAGSSLEGLEKAIDKDLSNHSLALGNVKLNIHSDVRQEHSDLKNVVGLLRGTDPKLRDQYIVIGGHYDHLGVGDQPGSMAPSLRGQIHHGADDNASGTAGVMELARIFGDERSTVRRSILFIAFSGEELGLLGSAHYVEQPLIPLDHTVAMMNLDMIGRVQKNKLYIGGSGTSPEFRKLVEEQNGAAGFDLDFSDQGFDEASDHLSFGRNQIPVLFFFSGLHSDYHKPSDTWDKVEPAETARVLELVARVVKGIDGADERPAFTPVTRQQRGPARASNSSGGGGYGPYFGSVPDFGENDKGLRFADISANSPAAQAGLRAGDILVKFDGLDIHNIYDFTYLLQGKQPGDEVAVTVLRSGEPVQATVKLARRE